MSYQEVVAVRSWPSQTGIELPDDLLAKLDILDAVQAYTPSGVEVDASKIAAKSIPAEIAKVSAVLAARTYATEAKAILVQELVSDLQLDIAELKPKIVDEIRPEFERQVEKFVSAVRSLPKPPKIFNGNVIESTAPSDLEVEASEAALREAKLAESYITAMDQWLRDNYACATPQLGIFQPKNWSQLQSLLSAEGAYHPNGLRADLMFAVQEGIGIGVSDPGSAAELERQLWAAKQRRR